MKLWEMTKLIRSKNAGPFTLTFDVIFAEKESYERIKASNLISKEWVAKTYKTDVRFIKIIYYDAANAIKVSIPRRISSGDVEDTDVYGGQQHGPFVTLDVAVE